MTRHLLPTLLLLGSTTASAAETGSDLSTDLRLAVGTAPGVKSHDFSGGAGGRSTDVDTNYGFEIEPGIFESWNRLDSRGAWGVLGGLSLPYRTSTGNNHTGGGQTKLETYGIKLAVGPSFTTGPIRLELTPYVGFGAAKVKLEGGPGGDLTSKRDVLIDYGISLGGYYDVAKTVFVGLQLGWDWFNSKVTFENAGLFGRNIDDTVKGNGLLALAVGGWRF
jgi:hypothetical protein